MTSDDLGLLSALGGLEKQRSFGSLWVGKLPVAGAKIPSPGTVKCVESTLPLRSTRAVPQKRCYKPGKVDIIVTAREDTEFAIAKITESSRNALSQQFRERS
jgi:hypothetical protein